MDGQRKIQLDFAEEECLDISISFTPACSIYLVVKKGLEQIKVDIDSMEEYMKSLEKPLVSVDDQARENLKMQAASEHSIAVLAYNQGLSFIKELHTIIKELESSQDKKKILIHKPTWTGTNT